MLQAIGVNHEAVRVVQSSVGELPPQNLHEQILALHDVARPGRAAGRAPPHAPTLLAAHRDSSPVPARARAVLTLRTVISW
jgi:hypothetical protein